MGCTEVESWGGKEVGCTEVESWGGRKVGCTEVESWGGRGVGWRVCVCIACLVCKRLFFLLSTHAHLWLYTSLALCT